MSATELSGTPAVRLPAGRSPRWGTAAVVGGSLGGLLAARVLSDHFERVVVVERDLPSDEVEPRKGVPQGRHFHVLQKGGERIVEALLPGICDELRADGSVSVNVGRDFRIFQEGGWFARFAAPFENLYQSRPLLERRIRRRVAALPGVELRHGCEAQRVVASSSSTAIGGIVIRGPEGAEEELATDLVIDAGGRRAPTPRWLESLGRTRPEETEIGIDFAYTTGEFEMPADDGRDWQGILIAPTAPDKRGGALVPMEGRRWLVTLAGRLGELPPTDPEEFFEFAQSLRRPELFDAIRAARPCSPLTRYRFPTGVLRHYERLRDFPAGLLPIGDAIASFNPIYGQGMSVCAFEIAALAELLQRPEAGPRGIAKLRKPFLARAARIAGGAWSLASAQDLRWRETRGRRPFGFALQSWLTRKIGQMAQHDEDVALRFGRVIQLVDPPSALVRPSILLKALRARPG